MSTRPFPWEGSYPPGLAWDCPIETGAVPGLLEDAVRDAGARVVIDFRNARLTYAELKGRVEAFATALLDEDIAGDRSVALYLPNTPYHPIAFFGALKAGARVVHLSPLDAPRELAHKLADSGARTLVTTNAGHMLEAALRLMDEGLVDLVDRRPRRTVRRRKTARDGFPTAPAWSRWIASAPVAAGRGVAGGGRGAT